MCPGIRLLDAEGATEVAGEEIAVRSDHGRGDTDRREDATDLVLPDARLLILPLGELDIMEWRDEGIGGGKSASSKKVISPGSTDLLNPLTRRRR